METVDLVIPIQRPTKQLEITLASIEARKNLTPYRIRILEKPDWNLSEVRQFTLEEPSFGPLICWLDDDSEMVLDHWLDEMMFVLTSNPTAGIVTPGEQWGTEPAPTILNYLEHRSIGAVMPHGASAACMLVDKRRLDKRHYWDKYIGLRSGWLGGDFEELDFCNKVLYSGLEIFRATGTYFHHTGGKTTIEAYTREDRSRCVRTMHKLLMIKYSLAPHDDEWFKHIKYVKADDNNDCKLAPGYTVRECYIDVIKANKIEHLPIWSNLW